MEQLFMFGAAPESAANTPRVVFRRDFGPAPKQRAMTIKLQRKIAYKPRTRELPGVGNDFEWSTSGIERLHRELYEDWEARMPLATNLVDQFDLWSWMLGDPEEAFSFRDCLIFEGYPDPDGFIEMSANLAPEWFKQLQGMPGNVQAMLLNEMVAKNGYFVPAARAA